MTGKAIMDVKYAQIDISGKYLYAKDESGKVEVYDTTGKITNMSENVAKLSVADGKYIIVITNEENKTLYGIQDSQEKELVKSEYNYIEYLYDNYFIASNLDGKLGIIDEKGNEKLEFNYNSIQKVKDTKLIQASISDENQMQIYTDKMEKISEISNAILDEVNGYIRIYNEEETIYITHEGKKVYNKEVYKNNKLFATKKDGKWGFENSDGEIKVECKYDRVTEFNEFGYAGILLNGKWGVIDSDMNIVLEPTYEIKSTNIPSFLGKYYKVTYGFGETYYTNR